VIVVVCVVMTLVLLGYVFHPERQVASQAEKTRLEFLRERKDVLYENLRDLNFEYRAGKYRDEEYANERSVMENEAAEVVGELERLEGVRR
jgi:hypothetical protein